MTRKLLFIGALAAVALAGPAGAATPLGSTRWTDSTPYGIFFNDYDPNFYTGFVPRVQERNRIKIHLARGNQLRVRMVLPDSAIDNYLTDQLAKHDLYAEVIDSGKIELTSNTAWEHYQKRVGEEGLRELAAQRSSASPEEWRELNLRAIDKLDPERLYHIQADFSKLAADLKQLLSGA